MLLFVIVRIDYYLMILLFLETVEVIKEYIEISIKAEKTNVDVQAKLDVV